MKIIFTGNFFRFFEDRHICVDILREIITPNISKIPGIQSEYMYPNRCNINNYKNLAERFAETEDMIINWQNYQEESAGLPENIFDDIYVDVDCVVGFEIPPSMCSLLSKKNKKYINFFIHPIRFCEDIFFEVATNDSVLADRIKQWEMQYQENAYVQADKVQIYTIAHRLNQKDMKSNTVAVFIQTKADASVISNGHFVSLADFSSKIEELSHEYDEVLLVKHPYEEILPELMTMLSSKISVVETNSYALLCNSNIKKVVTISSSIGCEAKFFEKETEFLLGEPLRKGGSLVARDTYSFALGQVLLQRDFWEHILVGKNQQSWKFAKHFEQPDLFRKLIHSWAYEDINPRNHNVSKRAYRKIGLNNLSLTEISGRIDLTSDNDRTKTSLLSGFSHAESDGRWTDGYKAEFFVYIGDSAKGVEIKINCAYLDDYAREQAIEVKVANKSVGTAIIHDQGVYVLRIPVVQKGGAVVELALPNASSPAKSGSADYRTLGLKINYIETTAKDVSELEALLYSSVKI